MTHLDAGTLATIGERVPVPTYERERVRPGIVHFGVGAFHRAHEAMFLDRILRADPDAPWGICGVGLLPFDLGVRDVLRAQDRLYTLVTKDPDGAAQARVIGSIVEFLYAPDDPEALLARLTSPEVRIVSMTITEGGYLVDEAGDFDASSPAVQADLADPAHPSTVFGSVTEGLRRRREVGLDPFTVMSCDNMQTNGDIARRAMTSFATLVDPDLGAWIEQHVSFPNSMVDRITPATTDAARAEVADRYGIEDAWPIVSESFVQWVLEDRFPAGRPPFETVGVRLVDDVEPYELMKLRLLNAAHQVMSHLGVLAGLQYVEEACTSPTIVTFLKDYMAFEASPTLQPVPGIDLPSYRAELISRFTNSAIADTLARQTVDASDRIPKFLLPVLRSQLRTAGPIDHVCLVIAAWSVTLEGLDEHGGRIEPVDRRLPELLDAARAEADEPGALLDMAAVFGDLGRDARFRMRYIELRKRLKQDGALATAAAVNQEFATPGLPD